MMSLDAILGIFLAGLLSNNYAIMHFLGTGAVIENKRSSRKSLLVGLMTTLVMVISTAITWPIQTYVLNPAGVSYLQNMVFVAVMLLVVELIHLFTKNKLEAFCKVDFMKFAINGAVMGLCIHNTVLDFVEAVVTAAAVGIGFMLTMTVFAKLSGKIDQDAVPAAFRGLPINLLCAGMIALALLAF